MSVKLPYQQSEDRQFNQFQQALAKSLSPILSNPVNDGVLLPSVALVTGSVNNIPHRLGRALSGWLVVRNRASSIIWDSQDSNTSPASNLALNCSADTTIDIWVF